MSNRNRDKISGRLGPEKIIQVQTKRREKELIHDGS